MVRTASRGVESGMGGGARRDDRAAIEARSMRMILQAVGDPGDGFVEVRVGDRERRCQAYDRVAVQRPVEDEPPVERARDEACAGRRGLELEREQQTEAAYLDEPAAARERAQAADQRITQPASASRELVRDEHLERGEAR